MQKMRLLKANRKFCHSTTQVLLGLMGWALNIPTHEPTMSARSGKDRKLATDTEHGFESNHHITRCWPGSGSGSQHSGQQLLQLRWTSDIGFQFCQTFAAKFI